MNRKILLAVVFCAVAGLSVAANATFGQEQQQAKPKLQVRHAIKPAKAADAEQVKSAVAAGKREQDSDAAFVHIQRGIGQRRQRLHRRDGGRQPFHGIWK